NWNLVFELFRCSIEVLERPLCVQLDAWRSNPRNVSIWRQRLSPVLEMFFATLFAGATDRRTFVPINRLLVPARIVEPLQLVVFRILGPKTGTRFPDRSDALSKCWSVHCASNWTHGALTVPELIQPEIEREKAVIGD